MDATLVYLALTFVPYVLLFLYRKRLITWFSRQFAQSVVAWAFVTKDMEQEDGTHVEIKAVSAPAKALLAAVVPSLIAEVAKNVKLRLPTGAGGVGLPANLDLSNLSEILPAVLPMLPKRYQGIVALGAPFLQGFLGGAKKGKTTAGESSETPAGPGRMG